MGRVYQIHGEIPKLSISPSKINRLDIPSHHFYSFLGSVLIFGNVVSNKCRGTIHLAIKKMKQI